MFSQLACVSLVAASAALWLGCTTNAKTESATHDLALATPGAIGACPAQDITCIEAAVLKAIFTNSLTVTGIIGIDSLFDEPAHRLVARRLNDPSEPSTIRVSATALEGGMWRASILLSNESLDFDGRALAFEFTLDRDNQIVEDAVPVSYPPRPTAEQ